MELSLILDTLDDLSKENKHLTELTQQINNDATTTTKLITDVVVAFKDSAKAFEIFIIAC